MRKNNHVSIDPNVKDNTAKKVILDNGETATQFAQTHTTQELVDEIRKLGAKELFNKQQRTSLEEENKKILAQLNELKRWETDFTQKLNDFCEQNNLEFHFTKTITPTSLFRTVNKDSLQKSNWMSFEEIFNFREEVKENPNNLKVPKIKKKD